MISKTYIPELLQCETYLYWRLVWFKHSLFPKKMDEARLRCDISPIQIQKEVTQKDLISASLVIFSAVRTQNILTK